MVKNLILSIIAIAILAGCSGKKDKTTDSDVVEAIPVKVQKLEKTDIARTLDYAANLEAWATDLCRKDAPSRPE